MADKKIQMTQRNATNDGWDNIYPKTTGNQVIAADGTTTFESHLADNTNAHGINTKAPIASPTFTGTAKVTADTNYTTTEIRNAYFSTTIPTTMNNGEICFVYTP